MKTTYTLMEVQHFLEKNMPISPSSLKNLAGGHSSQVIRFNDRNGRQLVMRIRENKQDLLADKYAFEHFSHSMPIPKFMKFGPYDDKSFYIITEFIEGVTVFSLAQDEFVKILPSIQLCLAKTFQIDITHTHGYGDIDIITGNAKYLSYKAFLNAEIALLGVENLRSHADAINLDINEVDDLVEQFEKNLSYVSEVRRLTHGDPCGDNMIVKDDVIKGVIDWEQMAYADWMRDFTRFEYHGDNRYGDAAIFANLYNLEDDNLVRRKAVYWAINALRDIEFAATQHNEQVAKRLRVDITQKIIFS